MSDSQTEIRFGRGSADEVMSGLKVAEDPVEFVRQNLKMQPVATVVPRPGEVVAAPEPEPVVPPVTAKPPAFAEPKDGDDLNLPLEVPNPETPPVPEVPEVPETPEPTELNGKGPAESLRDLRKKTNKLELSLREKETALTEAQKELEKHPTILREKEERIAQLEQYERLHALRFSPEYHQKYVEPLSGLREKAKRLAEEYQVDPGVLDRAMQFGNKRDLNAYLKNHFDDVGALEVREVLGQIKDLDTQALQAEQEPARALEEMQQEFQRSQEQQENHRISSITKNSRDGWIEGLQELVNSGKYPELTLRANDIEHNELARPLLESAAQEFGKMVKLMGINGTRDLPRDAAKILAKRYLLSQISAVNSESRAQHFDRAERMKADTQRQANMIRPPVGGGPGSSVPMGPPKPSSPEQAADAILRKIGVA